MLQLMVQVVRERGYDCTTTSGFYIHPRSHAMTLVCFSRLNVVTDYDFVVENNRLILLSTDPMDPR